MPKESTKATITSFAGTPLVRVVDGSLSRNISPANLVAEAGAQAALDGRYVSQANDLLRDGGPALRQVTLVGGHDDESPAATNCTITADTTNFKVGDRGWNVDMAGAVTAQFRLDPPATDDPADFGAASAIGMWVYVPDASKVTTISLELYSQSNLSGPWSRSQANAVPSTLSNGWNLLRWPAGESTLTDWGTLYRIRVVIVTSAATDITIGHVWAELRPKASIVFISDSCYESFYDVGYPTFRANGWPVNWAPDPDILGDNAGNAATGRMTEADLTAAMAGGLDEVSIHGWDGAATSAMTAAQLRTDTMRAIRWVQRRGWHTGLMWRAAYVQNSAAQEAAVRPLLWAHATPSSNTGQTIQCFPPKDRWNIMRSALSGLSQGDMDTMFANLETTKGVVYIYTHGITSDGDGGTNMTTANWNYFVALAEAGVAAGWLEFTTFSELFRRIGGRFVHTLGTHVLEWVDSAGDTQRQALP